MQRLNAGRAVKRVATILASFAVSATVRPPRSSWHGRALPGSGFGASGPVLEPGPAGCEPARVSDTPPDGVMRDGSLDERARAILDFEREAWQLSEPKERAIRARFGFSAARYHQLRLCVFNAPLTMRDFDVRYRNGGHQDIAVRQTLRAGTCTRNVDLAGNRRDVTAVRLKYSAIRRGFGRPIVRVQAR